MDYIEAFENLKPIKKYARKSPLKAVMLLTVIELYDSEAIYENIIEFNDQLAATYLNLWNKLMPNDTILVPEINYSFWAMTNENFWHIIPKRGKEDVIDSILEIQTIPTESTIKDCVKYVELDEDLYFMMTLPSGRKSLKEALLSNYFNLSKRDIQNLTSVNDNIITETTDFDLLHRTLFDTSNKAAQNTHSYVENQPTNIDNDVWLTICITYYKFLKKHRLSSDLFCEYFPSPVSIFKFITEIRTTDFTLSNSLHEVMLDFLHELNIALMSDNESISFINMVEDAKSMIELYIVHQSAHQISNVTGISPTIDDKENIIKVDCNDGYLESVEQDSNEWKVNAKGTWFDAVGSATNPTQIESPDLDETDEDSPNTTTGYNDKLIDEDFDYIPKGRIKNIEDTVDDSCDYLWTMAIIDLVYMTNRAQDHSLDDIACMMIANAWDLLKKNRKAFESETRLKECIEFLINESITEMEKPLTWNSTKEEVYSSIKNFPMSGIFEEVVDKLIQTAPYSVLKTWFSDTSDQDMIIEAKNFTRPCLYALYIRKNDSYIEVNKKWLNNLYYDHDNLIKYFSIRYYQFLENVEI